jgi:acetyl esterase/lipase
MADFALIGFAGLAAPPLMIRRRRVFLFLGFLLVAAAGFVAWRWWRAPYRHLPLDNRSPEAVARVDSMGRPLLRPAFADVAYAGASRFQKLDIYLPGDRSKPAPVVIWIHGGGLMMGDKRSLPRADFGPAPRLRDAYGPYQVQVPEIGALLARGYAVVSLNYRLGFALITSVKPAVADTKAAIRFLRDHAADYGLDPGRFAAWGNSMGGYLAAMAGVTGDQATEFDDASPGSAVTSSAVQAVVVWYGAEDRLPETLSIGYYAARAHRLPAFRIVNGDADPVIIPARAVRLNETLLQAGARTSLTILPGAGHEDPQFMATQTAPTLAFLAEAFAAAAAN